jgi:type II secretory pathway component PulF
MPKFFYKAIVSPGQRDTGTLVCRDRHDALCQIVSKGQHPLQIDRLEQDQQFWKSLSWRSLKRISTTELSVFTRQFSSLLKAGLTVVQTLRSLRLQSNNSRLTEVIQNMEARLQSEGGTLSEAMDEHPKVFNAVNRGLVRAGEEGGNLVEVFSNLAGHLMQGARLKNQVLSAFIYPVFLILLGTGAVFVLMAFVIPKFQELFDSFGGLLPLPTRVLIGVSDFLDVWWWAVLLAAMIVAAALLLILRRPVIRRRFDAMTLRFPVLGGMFLKIEVSRVARTLGALLNSGVKIISALRITGQSVNNRAIRGCFDLMIRDVSNGQPLAAVFEKGKVFPPLMINLIKTGEDTGELPEMLNELSDIYDDEAQRAINGAVKLLEPILICVMGLMITGIVAAVILPILKANMMVE